MLTREQFDSLRAKGLTVEQIVRFENGENPKQGVVSKTTDDTRQTDSTAVIPFVKNTLGAPAQRQFSVGQEARKIEAEGKAVQEKKKQEAIDVATEKTYSQFQKAGLYVSRPVIRQQIEQQTNEKPGLTIARTISDLALPELAVGVAKNSIGIVNKSEKVASNTVLKSAEKTAQGQVLKSAKPNPTTAFTQTGSELFQRVPRAIGRVKEYANEAALRSTRIKAAEPAVANAIVSKLDERIINTVVEVDDQTRKAFKRVVDIAEETPKTVGVKKQPSVVSGELASNQFDIINKEKQRVGKQLGDKVKELSKTEKVDMSQGFIELDDTLANQGIQIKYTKKGPKLDFSGTKYTPAERTKIQELYTLSWEGGEQLTPSAIHGKDQLFSKLQREANMEGVGKIIVDTPDGSKSLFSVFRDVFSKNLENGSPEIRELNKKYRDLSLVTQDIEDSILKMPNFNITKSADQAEFAKVNLRRIFGEAQSSPAFEAIADQMDALSRQLGYADASPKQVAEFAQELRKLYPESVPKAGFTGGISSGIKGALGSAIEATLKAGTPNLKDQRKALIELLDSYLTDPNKIILR